MSDKDKKTESQDKTTENDAVEKDSLSTNTSHSKKDDTSNTEPTFDDHLGEDRIQEDHSDKDSDLLAADSAFDDASDDNRDSSSQNSDSSATSGGSGKGHPPSNKRKNSSKTKPIKWFIVIIVLAAIAYAAYFGWEKWQDYQANSKKADEIGQLQQQLKQQEASVKQQLGQQQQKIYQFSDQLEQNQRYISQLQEQLSTTQRKIQAQSSDKQQEWLFNEAEYLVREASNKLNFTNDAAAIISLLKAADAQLAQLNDNSLLQVRQAISQDINAVRGSGNLDIEGIAINIETLKANTSQLELASVQLDSEQPKDSEPSAETDISSWQHFKNSLSNAASKYYTVHHFDESTNAFISPQQDRLLRENIMLNLQTAQLAALQNNQALYQSNLEQVEQWVTQYFKQQPASTTAFNQQLDELLNRSVELDLPSSLQSYELISDISKQKVDRWLNQDNASQSQDSSSNAEDEDSTTETPLQEEPSA